MVMARFARDCVQALRPLLRKLEVELGPDTADLGLRVGLNSGPVTVSWSLLCANPIFFFSVV